MKLSHFATIIIILFCSVFWMISIISQNTVAMTTSNRDYTQIITNACYDAIKVIDKEETYVFKEETTRKNALKIFYKTILKGLDIDNGINDRIISEKTPFVLLIDCDGYYLNYNTAFDTTMTISEPDALCACTGLNTWADTYTGEDGKKYLVRFFLNDYIEIIDDATGEKFKGTLDEAKEEYDAILPFLTNDYEPTKRYCIINCMEDTINYLLNTQNINIGSWRMGYVVSLSNIPGEDWTRMLKNPTIIGFLQGPNKNNLTDNLNVYGYAASEKIKGRLYYADETTNLYYRLEKTDVPTTIVTYNGTDIEVKEINQNIGSMKKLAEKGNDPDITTYRDQ